MLFLRYVFVKFKQENNPPGVSLRRVNRRLHFITSLNCYFSTNFFLNHSMKSIILNIATAKI